MYKKIIILLVSIILLCSCNKYENYKVGYSTNLINENDKEELKKVLNDYKLSNVDIFFKWLDEFNKEEDMGCGLKDWDSTDKFVYNEAACASRYEKNHDVSDGNCRLTAYTLLKDKISISDEEQSYGSYLMFDIDVLENNKDYEVIKSNENKFINLFNEMDVSNISKEEYKNVFPNLLNDNGFKIDDEKVSLISVVMNDSGFDLLYVGHAGVLIDLDDKYLFIEKIAFEQPYQVNVLKSKDDLKQLFKDRSNYFGDETEEGPFIYENDKLLFEF